MELAIYLAGMLEFFTVLFCMLLVFRIGRVGMSLMIACVVLVVKDIVDHMLVAEYATHEVSTVAMAVTWYSMFAITNFFAAFAIYIFHRGAPVKQGLAAKFTVWYCLFSALLQVARCGEKLYLNTDNLTPLYTYGVPFLNYLLIPVLIYGLYQTHKRSQDFEERIAWNI